MTYKQLIDELTDLLDAHHLVNQWGYGNISDIETPETGAPNYPYVFLNPQQVTVDGYGFAVTMNLIVMDQALDTVDAEVTAQSEALRIVQDVMAKFRLTTLYAQSDIQLGVVCTPFKERFKDDVVGMTALVTFEIAEPLDICDDPTV